MLDPKTRLRKALARQAVDRPPCICPGGMMNLVTRELMELSGHGWPAAHTDPAAMAALAAAAHGAGCFENHGLPFCMTVEAQALGARVAMGDMGSEPRVTAYPLSGLDGWEDLPAFDP